MWWQVLVSIQGLILVAEPYYNEAGFEKQVPFSLPLKCPHYQTLLIHYPSICPNPFLFQRDLQVFQNLKGCPDVATCITEHFLHMLGVRKCTTI